MKVLNHLQRDCKTKKFENCCYPTDSTLPCSTQDTMYMMSFQLFLTIILGVPKPESTPK